MSLNRRLERLETIVTETVTAEPSPEQVQWEAAWYWALELVLTNMPEDRARVVIDDLTHARDESPITRRVLTLAGSAVPAHWADPGACRKPRCECGWHYGHNDPLALPEAVCGLLDEHPEAVFDYLNCADCGYQSGERTREAWRRYPVGSQEITPAGRAYAGGRAYFERCPLCGGAVGWRAFQVAATYRMPEARQRRAARDPDWARRHGVAVG